MRPVACVSSSCPWRFNLKRLNGAPALRVALISWFLFSVEASRCDMHRQHILESATYWVELNSAIRTQAHARIAAGPSCRSALQVKLFSVISRSEILVRSFHSLALTWQALGMFTENYSVAENPSCRFDHTEPPKLSDASLIFLQKTNFLIASYQATAWSW